MQHLSTWLRRPLTIQRPKEVGLAIAVLIVTIITVSLITPYQPQTQRYSFYESDQAESVETLYRAEVTELRDSELSARLLDGQQKGNVVTVSYEKMGSFQRLESGSLIILASSPIDAFVFYSMYRLPFLIVLTVLFIIVVLLVGRRQGFMSLLGLGAGILVVVGVTIPLTVNGYDTFWVTTGSAFLIALVSVLVAHGWNRRTVVSLIAIMTVLLGVTILAKVTTYVMGLTGIVGEADYFLSVTRSSIDLSGILVGGIVIATLGALDDIVTTQVATVDVLRQENPAMSRASLYAKAAKVGSEHIAALVNTLALVYVGASLPVLVVYAVSDSDWFRLLNQGFVATEIARTLVVSIGLVLAVPFSTWLATQILSRPSLLRKKRN